MSAEERAAREWQHVKRFGIAFGVLLVLGLVVDRLIVPMYHREILWGSALGAAAIAWWLHRAETPR